MKFSKNYFTLFFIILILGLFSCHKKYERPDQYEIDLFKNDREVDNDVNKRMTKEEAFEASEVVILTDSIKLLDKSITKDKVSIYIYQVVEGVVVKGVKDSVDFPINILSVRELVFKKQKNNIYLEDLKTFKLLVRDFNIKYQILPQSPLEENN